MPKIWQQTLKNFNNFGIKNSHKFFKRIKNLISNKNNNNHINSST